MKHINTRIEENMTPYPCFASTEVSVLEAAEFMEQMGFRHLPVIDSGKLLGVVSDRDLKQAAIIAKPLNLKLKDIMTEDPFTAKVGTPLSEVIAAMAEKRIGSALIVNSDDAVVGIFTTTDGLNILKDLLITARQPSVFEKGVEGFLERKFLI